MNPLMLMKTDPPKLRVNSWDSDEPPASLYLAEEAVRASFQQQGAVHTGAAGPAMGGSEACTVSDTQGHMLVKVEQLALVQRRQAWCQETLDWVLTLLLSSV